MVRVLKFVSVVCVMAIVESAVADDLKLDWVIQSSSPLYDVARGIVGDGNGRIFWVGYEGSTDRTAKWGEIFPASRTWAAIEQASVSTADPLPVASTSSCLFTAHGNWIGNKRLSLSLPFMWNQPMGEFGSDITAIAPGPSDSVFIAGRGFGVARASGSTVLWSVPSLLADTSLASDTAGNLYYPFIEGLLKVDLDGNPLWMIPVLASKVVVNPVGGVFAASSSALSSVDTDGNTLWTVPLPKVPVAMASDQSGNVYTTWRTLDAGGFDDVLLKKFSRSGEELWTYQLGTPALDGPTGLWADPDGTLYLSGATRGNLGGPVDGGIDMFFARFSPVPEPGILAALMGIGVLLGLRRHPRGR